MITPKTAVLALSIAGISSIALFGLTGSSYAQNQSAGTKGAPTAAGKPLSPDKQAMLNRMPRMSGRYRSVVRRNLEQQQAREDMTRAAAEQKAEADRKEALRKAELRRAAADASRALKEREQDRAERARKPGDVSAPAGSKKVKESR